MNEMCYRIDYFSEAIGLLTHIGKGASYMELKRSLTANKTITFENKKFVFEVLTKIEKAAQKYFFKEKEEISYYFKAEENAVKSCGEVLILWDGYGNEPYCSIEEVEQYLTSIEEKVYTLEFGKCLQSYTNTIGDESSYEKLDEPIKIISYLMNMDVSQEEKWKIQTIFLNRKEHFPKVMNLIYEMIDFLKGYEGELLKLVGEFYDYWKCELKSKTLAEYMQKRIVYNLPPNPFGYRVRPSIMIPNILGIHVDTDELGDYKKQDEVWIGVLFGEELKAFGGEKKMLPDAQQVIRTMKLLSDKSKFEILCRLNKEPAYGNQLAKEMNLTAATISHHMSTLIAEGLVTIQMVEKKVYYQQDKEKLKKILERSWELLGI